MTEIETVEFIPDLFNGKAGLRPLSDFAPEDLARMSEIRRELFFSAHKSASEVAEVEQAARDGDVAERAASALVGERQSVVNSLIPPWTAMDEFRLMVKHIARPDPTPEVQAAFDLAKAQLATAQAELVQVQARTRLCHEALKPARKFAADQWARYHSAFPPKTANEVHRELMAREQERKLAGISDASQAPQPRFLCELDRSMAMKGGSRRASRHPNASGQTFSQAMQNQTVVPPVAPVWETKKMGSVRS